MFSIMLLAELSLFIEYVLEKTLLVWPYLQLY